MVHKVFHPQKNYLASLHDSEKVIIIMLALFVSVSKQNK